MSYLGTKPTKLSVLLFLSLFGLLLSGCQSSGAAAPPSPFSDASWEYTVEDLLAYEGDSPVTYDSVYGGICYTYPKTWQERPGTIKYMYNQEERLMCIAWTCPAEEEQELYDLYDIIEESVNTRAGGTDKTSNYGHVWYRDEGNIILSLMITSDLKALQYAYLHPEVSSPPKE